MDCLQEPKDLITIFYWGPSGGQVASFFPNSSICMQHQKGMLGVRVNGYCFSFSSAKPQVRAMSSANWAEVPGGKGLASMVSKLGLLHIQLFLSKTKLLPSVCQICSELVRGSSDNPSWGFAQWSKVSRQT